VTEAFRLDPDTDCSTSLDAPEDSLEDALRAEPALGQVEIEVERAEGRQRQISAKIQIPNSIEQVWQILTDYDRLADFIPSLTKSRRIDHPEGGIRIEQVGAENLFGLKFCARVVLDMVEKFPCQIDFEMVKGDFKIFAGSWQLEPIEIAGQMATTLRYTVCVLPPRTMPIGMIERRLSNSLAANLVAIQKRVDSLFSEI
jgi:ribosome-associated toxin RatA of RatAB toxin-antitoxin module